MKKLIAILLWATLFLPSSVFAYTMCTAGISACNTQVSSDTTGATVFKIGSDVAYGFGIEFVGSVNDCICKAVVSLKKVGAPNGTLSFKLREKDGSTNPGTVIATAAETKTAADLTTSAADYAVTFNACGTISATNNYITIESDTLNSSTVYFGTLQNTTGAHKTVSCAVAGCATGWSSSDATAEGYLSVYK
jgi:hypothetical protein